VRDTTDIMRLTDDEKMQREIAETIIYVSHPGNRRAKERAILEYRHNRDMILWDRQWKSGKATL